MEKTIRDALNERVISESGLFFGIARENIKTLGGFENFVFEYEDNNELFILRLVHSSHRKSTFVEAELEFIDHLSKNGARVSVESSCVCMRFILKIWRWDYTMEQYKL